jgi:YggT family protein
MDSLKLALLFLINFVFAAYVYILLVRLLMQKFGASWHNPISQFVIKLTDPIIKPVRKLIPGFRGFDLAILVLALLIDYILMYLVIGIQLGIWSGFFGVFIVTVGEITKKLMNIIFVATIIWVIISWFAAARHSSAAEIVACIVEPFLAPLRRIIPLVGGFDLSPIALIILTRLIIMLVANPVIRTGLRIAIT